MRRVTSGVSGDVTALEPVAARGGVEGRSISLDLELRCLAWNSQTSITSEITGLHMVYVR